MTSLAVTGYKKNRLFPSYLLPLFQNESSWETIHMFRLQAHFHANQTHFHKKAIARRLVLKEQLKVTQNAALSLQLGLPSTLIRHKNAALSLQLGLPSTLIRHKNTALSLQLGLPSTLIRHKNAALSLQLGLPSTLIRHKNLASSLQLGLPSTLIRHRNGAFRKRPSNRRNLKTPGFRFQFWMENILKTELSENNGAALITWFPG